MELAKQYLGELKKRAAKSKVYKRHQLAGLEIAAMLEDEAHKSLYIKLAKKGNIEKLFRFAKEISEKKHVKNKGAYFMKVIAR